MWLHRTSFKTKLLLQYETKLIGLILMISYRHIDIHYGIMRIFNKFTNTLISVFLATLMEVLDSTLVF